MSTTVHTPATKEEPRLCASLTTKGRPCKARAPDPEIPYCHTHIPRRTPAEFVGGPLDGLCFWQRGGSGSPSEIMGIDRSRMGKVVLCSPDCSQDPKQYAIGVYRFQYDGLTPVWRWQPTVDD